MNEQSTHPSRLVHDSHGQGVDQGSSHGHTCKYIRIYIIGDAPRDWGYFHLTLSSAPCFAHTHVHRTSLTLPLTSTRHNQSPLTLANMPSTTSDRKVQSRIKATNVARGARASSESSDTSPERAEGNQTTCSGPDDLDQPWPYQFKVTTEGPRSTAQTLKWFQVRETVWVRIQEDGKWCQGTIISSKTTTDKVREGATVSNNPQ